MVEGRVDLRNCKIGFRNFSGKEGQYNREGDRSFAIFLDQETGISMKEEGWNVKFKEDRDGEPYAYIEVTVSYNNIPPTVMLINSTSKVVLDETSIAELDYVEIKTANCIIKPYNWTVNGKSGVKAYLYRLYIEVEEDVFEAEYADIPLKNRG